MEFSIVKFNHFCSIHSFTGCPNASYFGENCSTPCHQNCLEDRCDIVGETCLGCIPGYTGRTCYTGCIRNYKKKKILRRTHPFIIYIILYSIIQFTSISYLKQRNKLCLTFNFQLISILKEMKYYTFLIVVQTSYMWFIHVLWFWAMCKWLNVLAKLCVKNAINVYIFKNALVY